MTVVELLIRNWEVVVKTKEVIEVIILRKIRTAKWWVIILEMRTFQQVTNKTRKGKRKSILIFCITCQLKNKIMISNSNPAARQDDERSVSPLLSHCHQSPPVVSTFLDFSSNIGTSLPHLCFYYPSAAELSFCVCF